MCVCLQIKAKFCLMDVNLKYFDDDNDLVSVDTQGMLTNEAFFYRWTTVQTVNCYGSIKGRV